MRIIKEFCPSAGVAVVRSDCYGSSMAYIQKLIDEARKDYDIKLEMCDVRHYGGERYARTFGIEFPVSHAADGYEIIEQLEMTK